MKSRFSEPRCLLQRLTFVSGNDRRADELVWQMEVRWKRWS